MDEPIAAVVHGRAMLNITYAGQNSDLPDAVMYDSTDEELKRMAIEALQAGLPGIAPVEADLSDFVVDRFGPTPEIPMHRIFIRPKTPFG